MNITFSKKQSDKKLASAQKHTDKAMPLIIQAILELSPEEQQEAIKGKRIVTKSGTIINPNTDDKKNDFSFIRFFKLFCIVLGCTIITSVVLWLLFSHL